MRQIQHDKEQGTQNKEATSLSPSSVPVASFVLHAQFLVVLSFDLGVDLVRRTSRVGPWARIAENDEQEKSTWPVVLGVGSFVVRARTEHRQPDRRIFHVPDSPHFDWIGRERNGTPDTTGGVWPLRRAATNKHRNIKHRHTTTRNKKRNR